MDIWWLHALTFIFGYVTCKTFYFLNVSRISLKLLKSSRVIYLLMITKALEHYVVSEQVMKNYLKESGQDTRTQEAFKIRFENEVDVLKRHAIRDILRNTPSAFRPGLEFHDWSTAMTYLQLHQEDAYNFWRLDE